MDHLPHLVLLAVHDLARADLAADAGAIARVIGTCGPSAKRATATECAAALVHLDERGLVDARRARLTMRGLVIAASLRAAVAHGTIATTAPASDARLAT
jgi:hypothetical protein